MEDEWLIVYLLRELSKSFPQLWIRLSDSDGEFLLIEAAKVLPKWLSPENDGNRVWIHRGELRMIPLQSTDVTPSRPLSLPEALRIISSAADSLIHSTLVEAEAFYRLEKYPGLIADSTHHSLVTMPRKLAYIMHAIPKAIAPATEAFYLRDPLALRPILSPSGTLQFPPKDLVTVSTRFTKVLYAQLVSQRFDPPPAWSGLLQSAETEGISRDSDRARILARLELGMKVTTGFEILARDAYKRGNRTAREIALLLEDLEEDGDSALPSDEDIRSWKDVSREDDDSWMDIDFGEFEKELEGRKANARDTKTAVSGFGDASTQADLQKIVSRFEAFLNDDDAGMEGAKIDEMDEDDDDSDTSSSDDEDRDVSFDEEQFGKMMREMMGLPSEESREKGKQRAAPDSDNIPQHNIAQEEEESEEEQIKLLAAQMESELKRLGALVPEHSSTGRLEVQASRSKQNNAMNPGVDTTDDGMDDTEVNIDYNIAKNLLESFKSQAGLAGPTGNLLSLMGMALPRDEGESDDE